MQNRNATVELAFADGTYTFRLAWGGLEKVQEACDAGPYVVFERLSFGQWKTNDIREVIRQGLLGGGNDAATVRRLIRDYVEERPPLEVLPVAKAVMAAALIGAREEDDTKKPVAASENMTESQNSQMEKSALPQSMAQAHS